MSKRELNISDKKLYNTTKEDIVFRSPSRIPPRGIQDLISLKGINSSEVAYYDIALTEQQGISNTQKIMTHLTNDFYNQNYISVEELNLELEMKMGEFTDLIG